MTQRMIRFERLETELINDFRLIKVTYDNRFRYRGLKGLDFLYEDFRRFSVVLANLSMEANLSLERPWSERLASVKYQLDLMLEIEKKIDGLSFSESV